MTARMLPLLVLLASTPLWAMSSAEETQLGTKFDLEVRAKLPILRDVEVEHYLDSIGTRIVARLDQPAFTYRLTPLRDDRVNAFAVPGGFVYVNAGLLLRAGNDDEVAGVIGHEIAHVQAHHLARQQESSKLLSYAAIAGLILSAIQPAIGAGAMAASSAAQLKYQREFEQEADYLGARYVRDAGYDPRGMLDFFKRLDEDQHSNPTLVPPYLLTHPLTAERLTNLEAVLRQRQWDSGPRRPESFELERVRLLVRLNLQPVTEVVGEAQATAAARPDDGRAQYLYGLALLHAGHAAAARIQFERAEALGSGGVDRELGRVALMQRRLDEATQRLQRATQQDAGDPIAFRDLGRALEASGAAVPAMAAYERAVQLAPRLDDVHQSLGILAGRNGKPVQGYYHLGEAALLRGNADVALEHFAKAEQARSEDPVYGARAAESRARLLQTLGR